MRESECEREEERGGGERERQKERENERLYVVVADTQTDTGQTLTQTETAQPLRFRFLEFRVKRSWGDLEERLPFSGEGPEDGAAVVDEEGRGRDGARVGRGADVIHRQCRRQPVVVQVLSCRGWR